MLVVWQFGNFIVPAIIMAPIPLTLLGIVPGHWLLNAEFTATSMIGWIALAGIIVRNSILLVDFTVQEYAKGMPFFEAVVRSCSSRTRPILITALALVAGSSVILSDPIFQGMAISLLFGVLISTVLTLIVIPMGALSAGENSFKNVAISMGLITSDEDEDEKYNIDKPESFNAKDIAKKTLNKSKEITQNLIDKKNEIKAKKSSQDNTGEKKSSESKENKIDTNGFLKKEDKGDL
jgi:predicted RND superfamily exporter protein